MTIVSAIVIVLVFAVSWHLGYRRGMKAEQSRWHAINTHHDVTLNDAQSATDSEADARVAMAARMGFPVRIQEAMRHAPQLFNEARRLDAIRQSIMCSVDGCGEATQILCPECGERVCMKHLGNHDCVAIEREPR